MTYSDKYMLEEDVGCNRHRNIEMWTSYVESDLFSFEFTSEIDSVFLI